tara:strand:- start:1808 stop:2176 length:369 start_codon:yes stop_codon:yes gene_type:complete
MKLEVTYEHSTLKRIKSTQWKPYTEIKIGGIEFQLSGHGCLKKDACLFLLSTGFPCRVVQNGKYLNRYKWVIDGRTMYSSSTMKLPIDVHEIGVCYPHYVDEWPVRDRQLLNRVLKRAAVIE